MNRFTQKYIVTGLWSSTDESRDDGGDPLSDNYGISDIEPASLAKMEADCQRFLAANEADLAFGSDEHGGHDFWLTRNGHGAGFWDGDWPEQVGERLTDAAKAFGECNLYIGDDGKIHAS